MPKMIISYQCEQCGINHKTEADALKCEAEDLCLTLEEYEEYRQIQEKVRRASSERLRAQNADTITKYDIAVGSLHKFMQEHNIS